MPSLLGFLAPSSRICIFLITQIFYSVLTGLSFSCGQTKTEYDDITHRGHAVRDATLFASFMRFCVDGQMM